MECAREPLAKSGRSGFGLTAQCFIKRPERSVLIAILQQTTNGIETASYFPLSASLQDLGTLNVFHALPPEGL